MDLGWKSQLPYFPREGGVETERLTLYSLDRIGENDLRPWGSLVEHVARR
jgi:hypothetical protein